MPTYRNDTSVEIRWKGISWASGESRALDHFVPDAALGLTKISDSPSVPSPILLSQDVVISAGGSQTLQVPHAGRFVLSAVAVLGTAKMRVGAGTEDVTLDATTDYEGTFAWDRAAMIALSSIDGATVRIVAEEVG
jgi:hypothetical protein